MRLDIELLHTPHCPHHQPTRELLREVLDALELPAQVQEVAVKTMEGAKRRLFPGSPTLRVNGVDLEGSQAPRSAALACRLYQASGTGVPPRWLLEAGLLRALAPRHLLFLCVANSARSQLAEALARQRAPTGLRVSSAGSAPTSVRPEVTAVLKEVGLEAQGLRSKGLEAVELDTVEALITLCEQEVCPTFPRPVPRLHWALSDPATVKGSPGPRLAAYRRVRDELTLRLDRLLDPAGWPLKDPG